MADCRCRCHLGGAHVACDVGPEQPGGNQSCMADPEHVAPDRVPLDEACILGHAEPVRREFGYACKRHWHWLDAALRQIEELFVLLPDVLIPGPAGDGRSATRVGSPAPGRIEVMALTDQRVHGLTTHRDGEGVEDIPDLPGSLAQWARMVVEERATTDELTGDVAQSVRILRRERGWIVRQEWLDLFAEEIGDLHRAVARGIGDTMWPRPIGKCPNDQTPLYNTIGLDEVTCRKCKATWRGVHLARLRLIHEQEAQRHESPQAANGR